MTQPIEAAITAIAAKVAGVTGIKQATTYPNETQNTFPFTVTYLGSMVVNAAPVGNKMDLANINVDLFTPRIFLANDMALLTPFLDTVSAALLGEVGETSGVTGSRFTGTIQTFDHLEVTLLPEVDYAGVTMIGYRFTMVKTKLLVSL